MSQNRAADSITEFYKDLHAMQQYLERTKDDSKKELKNIDDQFEQTKKLLKEQCGNRNNPKPRTANQPQDQPNEYLDWVEKDVPPPEYTFISFRSKSL